jgi:hypothetical protein
MDLLRKEGAPGDPGRVWLPACEAGCFAHCLGEGDSAQELSSEWRI